MLRNLSLTELLQVTRFFMFLFSPCDALLEYQKQRALRPKCRLSFVHALEVVRDAIAEFQIHIYTKKMCFLTGKLV
jgi:hypothetical protein